ncbi:hypothetical protein VU01_10983 [Candidatus Electrothrix marina]|uniref:Uncharacterized protein n=1 Tax=Candidatus Electrothrix marina TaxID=1859130 RepID=A0A444JF12_9BACT|nr:hypothetical protein VU01_10983 [Candidatus Electrothrix marina]
MANEIFAAGGWNGGGGESGLGNHDNPMHMIRHNRPCTQMVTKQAPAWE